MLQVAATLQGFCAKRRNQLLVAAGLAVVAFGLYARTRAFPFTTIDDPEYVTNSLRVRMGLTWGNVTWAFSTLENEFWHPLTWLSYMLDVSLFGLRPGPMHLVNAGFHAANSVLVFVALTRLTGAPCKSAVVAAVFAVHPMHVESVAWISERKDVLSTFFGLLALVAYCGYARRPGPWRFALVGTAVAASLMAKATLVTLPFLFLLLDAWPLGRLRGVQVAAPRSLPRVSWGRALLEKLPLLALSAAIGVATIVAQRRGYDVANTAPTDRLGNALVSYVAYIAKLLWPAHLSVYYPAHHGLSTLQLAAAASLLIAVTAIALAVVRHEPAVAVGWFWFLGTLAPVIGVVGFASDASMADRYTYFPSIGIFLAITWGVGRVRGAVVQLGAVAGALTALVLLTMAAHRQVGRWESDESLFQAVVATTGQDARGHELLGYSLLERGKYAEAREHLQEAARISPRPAALNHLGFAFSELGMSAEAEAAFRLALDMEPEYDPASVNLADLLQRSGRAKEASEILLRAARRPLVVGHFEVRHRSLLGAALVDAGLVDDGVGVLEGALSLDPRSSSTLTSLAAAYWYRQDRVRAEHFALRAIAEGAGGGEPYLVLGAVRMANGDPAGAVDALLQSVRGNPEEPFRRLPLADALMGLGRTEEACTNWAFVLDSSRATPTDRERASRGVTSAGCPHSSGR